MSHLRHLRGRRCPHHLTQPEVRNAFSDEVIADMTAAFTEVGARADVRAVVLAAEGPTFCAGASLNWMRRMAGPHARKTWQMLPSWLKCCA